MARQEESNKVIYSLVGVGKTYGTKQVLKDSYFGYFYGAKIGVLGLNGAGKSSLLRILAGLDVPTSGRVAFDGVPLPRDEASLRAYRRTVGTVFQAYNLFPHLSALQNAALGLRPTLHPRPEERARAEAALERARVLEAYSRQELERAENLVRSGGITDKDLKAAQLAARDARAQTALAEAQLAQARAALEVAQKQLRDTVIRAPVSGEIERKLVNPGAYVEPPTPVFRLVDNRQLELESSVPAVELASVRRGQKVTFKVSSYPSVVFEGRVVEVNPAVDAQTRSVRVRIAVDNSSGRLKAGMFATAEVLTASQSRAIVVPAAAVYRADAGSSEAYVFVVENGRAVHRAVRVGRERDSELEIVSGLGEGDRLIVEPNLELAEGVPVEPAGSR